MIERIKKFIFDILEMKKCECCNKGIKITKLQNVNAESIAGILYYDAVCPKCYDELTHNY